MRLALLGCVLGLSGILLGCEALDFKPSLLSEQLSASGAAEQSEKPGEAATVSAVPEGTLDTGTAQPKSEILTPGTERFVRVPPRRAVVEKPPAQGDVTLNFENTNILEVVKVILGDLLQQNYRIGPGVQGTVTLQTSKPIPRAALLPTLEMLLRANNAALVYQSGLYHVIQQDTAIRGFVSPQLGDDRDGLPRGYSVRIVPLKFIAAQEMHKILEPFTNPGNIVRVDTPRNLLILAGSGPELSRLIETIEVFDVDWMAGMSVGMFRPRYVDAKTLASELRTILEDEGNAPLAGVIRIVDLERLNALMVITPRKLYLERVAQWIDRLDQDTGGVGQRLYVYHVQNGRAAELAEALSQVFEAESAEVKIPAAQVAPGLQPLEVTSAAAPSNTASGTDGGKAAGTTPTSSPTPAASPARVGTGTQNGLTLTSGPAMRIIADEVNNALLVKATAQDYKLVEAALRQLDIVPLQVLVEATIAEITLTGELRYGLEWYFKNSVGNYTGQALLDTGAAGLAAITPGFSYAVVSSEGVRAVLNSLASEQRVNVLSSPSLMVLNNQTATINVGDEVPITTQQQQSTAEQSTIVNNIEFRDTGVLLTVTPRVNAGGLVTMEVEQEVSNVAPGTADSLTPTIQQRKITSTVAVKSGDTVVLGGLIRENTSHSKSGIPVLHELPVLGALFGSTNDDQRRTELVVLITPRAVQDRESARRITEEFRHKMHSLRPPETPPESGGKHPAPSITGG